MIRRLAILDVETSGVSPETDHCIEVAVILYDLARAAPIASFASVMRADTNAAFSVNRIPTEILQDAPPAEEVWRRIMVVTYSADVFVAHQASFDRSFTPEPLRSSKPWVCSMNHIEWPESKCGESLVKTALAHGIGVVHAHRAMSDVDTLSRLLTRVQERTDLQSLFARAMRPRKMYVSLASFDMKDVVKAHGFQWVPDKAVAEGDGSRGRPEAAVFGEGGDGVSHLGMHSHEYTCDTCKKKVVGLRLDDGWCAVSGGMVLDSAWKDGVFESVRRSVSSVALRND